MTKPPSEAIVSKDERIDYSHFAGKYAYATGADGSLWTRAELKILLDEINRMYEREDKLIHALRCAHADLQGLMQEHYTNGGGGRFLHPTPVHSATWRTLEELDQLSNEIEELKP